MLECLTKINWKKVGLFTSGTLFGTAGIKVLASDDAKKVYTNCTAAAKIHPEVCAPFLIAAGGSFYLKIINIFFLFHKVFLIYYFSNFYIFLLFLIYSLLCIQ